MKYFYTFLLPTLLCFGSASGLQEETTELIKSELHYCRYIAWNAKVGWLPTQDALEWVDDIVRTVIEQIEEDEDD